MSATRWRSSPPSASAVAWRCTCSAHVAFRLRNVHTLNTARLTVAIVLLALIPVATTIPALAAMAIVAALMVALLSYEFIHFHEARERLRHALG